MKFITMIKALHENKWVRRSSWDDREYMYLEKDYKASTNTDKAKGSFFVLVSGKKVTDQITLSADDIYASDWQILTDAQKE